MQFVTIFKEIVQDIFKENSEKFEKTIYKKCGNFSC